MTTTDMTQSDIDAAHARYLALASERDRLADTVIEASHSGSIPSRLHDARDDIDREVLDAAEELLAALGYAR